jgi:hypothetical protein
MVRHARGDAAMSLYEFTYIPDGKDQTRVTVSFDDNYGSNPFIEPVIIAFEQFLLGVTFQPGSIEKYINREALHKALLRYAQLSEPK